MKTKSTKAQTDSKAGADEHVQEAAQEAQEGGFEPREARAPIQPLRLVVMGVPRPQPRPRFAKGRVVSTVDPKIRGWQRAVEHAAKMAKQALHTGTGQMAASVADALGRYRPLKLSVTFFFGTRHQERWGLPHTHKPDVDNLAKLIMDVLVKAQLITGDDCRISLACLRKVWCDLSGSGAVIMIEEDREAQTHSKGVRHIADAERPAWL
jgi:Holliday junction resolvase RusA-like endonuclease